jgi:hydroxymethylbilane synthase
MKASLRPTLTAGTRTSKLALWQTNHIIQRLQAAWPGLNWATKPVITMGDRTLDRALPQIGGKGLFTLELEEALREGSVDIAVHSLKDLPVEDAPGLILGAITERADVRDALVGRLGWTIKTLPEGAVVGTSSVRRQAQLLAARPDLQVKPIRGNVDTRVRKVQVGEYDAVLLAMAGLQRLGLNELVTQCMDLELMLPAPGQGALAVQCRADDEFTLRLLAAIDDEATRRAVTAERAFLSALGGGCSAPVAAYATTSGEDIHLRALIAAPDGSRVYRVSGTGEDARALGQRLAQQAIESGGAGIVTLVSTGTPHASLKGKRIVVTRPLAQAAELSRKLTDLGACAVEIPMLRIAPMPDTGPMDQAIQSLREYDWVIFTSVNGVETFWDRMMTLIGTTQDKPTVPGGPSLLPDKVKIATVGPSTANALVERGAQPDFTPDEFIGEAVAAGLGELTGQRILLPRAEIGRETLPEMLRAQGADVVDLPVYRTLPAEIEARGAAELEQGVDVVTFTSSSAVRNWVNNVGALHPEPLIACIGPVTAQTARELGLSPAVIAVDYSMDGLLQALVTHFQKSEMS